MAQMRGPDAWPDAWPDAVAQERLVAAIAQAIGAI
jgi:hypothetical protein